MSDTLQVLPPRRLPHLIAGECVDGAPPARTSPSVIIALYQKGLLPVNRLMTGTLTLHDINEESDHLHSGKAIRQVVVL